MHQITKQNKLNMNLKHLFLTIVASAISFSAIAQSTTGEKIKAFANEHLKLSGYIQGGYEWNEATSSENDSPISTFYLKRARVILSGDAAQEKIDYRLQVDMAGSPQICDLYVRYKPLNGLKMQLGQFKVPFAIENELCGPTSFEFIDYSYITTYFSRNDNRYDGIKAGGRDIGFQLYGGFINKEDFSIINYNLAVFNGSGINIKDNNLSKDLVARVIVKPIKDLSISASYMYAETNFNGVTYMKSPRWSVGAWYNSRHWVARAEYAEAKFGDTDASSLYALAGYHFEKPWSIVARYEFINDTSNILDQERITLGGVYKPYNFLRIQLNTTYTMYNKPQALIDNALGVNLMVTAIF